MSRKCEISGKGRQKGFNVSHAHNKRKKFWEVNLRTKRLFNSETGKWTKIRVSARMLREIDRKGLAAALRDHAV
jgi:large subunit ribosomal protein L28